MFVTIWNGSWLKMRNMAILILFGPKNHYKYRSHFQSGEKWENFLPYSLVDTMLGYSLMACRSQNS